MNPRRRAVPFVLVISILLATVPALFAADVAPEGRSPTRLVVQFDENARVRVRGGRLVSFANRDLAELEGILVPFGPTTTRPMFVRSEGAIDLMRARAETRSGRELPDLNSYVELDLIDPATDRLLESLNALDIVRIAYRASLPAPPPVDIPPVTPDGEADQIYIDAAPRGIDARAAWTRPGGRGEGVFLVDIEYDWRDTHEDLESSLNAFYCFTPNAEQFIEHGTAVLGEIIGGDNGYGVTGIASAVDIGMVTHYPNGTDYNVARSIECAAGLMEPGDVLLIEAQTFGPHGLFVPPEYDQAEYDAIAVASAAGIVVVETAGNGDEDLDHIDFAGKFDRAVRDSGALIVGAGADFWYEPDYQPDRSRLDFSTYGSRVDLQGWGDDVITTGYGDAFDGDGDPNQYYTDLFSGTSSAAPMIAGAAAVMQGVQMACGGPPLEPAAIRDLLVATGSPQVAGPYPGHIGPRPDLAAALVHVDVDDDLDGFAECHGDCDDVVAATHPGADEVNDGLDNQCPADTGYGNVDEISGDAGFHDPADRSRYSWTSQSAATRYEVSRSDDPAFGTGCANWETTDTFLDDTTTPAPGDVLHYLVRPMLPNAGSWGSNSAGTERTGGCL